METNILEVIEFEIPIDIPYFSLTNSFDQKNSDVADSMALVGQCLGFLKEGILASSDFSLSSSLGRHILGFYTTKRFGDVRIKEVYIQIKQRR